MEINANTEVKAGLETNHIIDLSDRLYRVVMVVGGVAVLAGLVFAYYQFKILPQNYPQQISVTGEGKAYAKPDVAVMSFGVTTQAVKSQDAVNQNNEKMNAVITAIKSLGVEEKDIRTTLYQLNPTYGSDQVYPSYPYPYPDRGDQITGYSLQQQVEVKMRNFEKVNEIIDAVTAKGANVAGSLQFTIDDPETARAEARAKAIEQAKQKAESLFAASGLKMGKLVNVYEGGFGGCGYGGCPMPAYGLGGAIMDKATVAPEIQPGQSEIITSVTLTYWVK